MPTQPVIEKLKELQGQLESISGAVKHIDSAAKVAVTSSDILAKIPELINDIGSLEEKHHHELLEVHKERIGGLEAELLRLLSEFKEKSTQLSLLNEEAKKLETTISDYFTEIQKINFPERLDKIDNQISAINIGVGNLQTSIHSTQTKVDAVQSVFASLMAQNALIMKAVKTNRIISISIGTILLIGIVLIIIMSQLK